MASPVLEAIRLKVTRAENHLEEFKANYQGRKGPVFPPNAIGIHLHDDRKGITVDTHALKPAQQRWLGILIGDVIHQLRASLDHIVYALATRKDVTLSEKELKALEFIIRKQPIDFASDWRVSQGWFEQKIGREELAALESAQPYKRDPIMPETDPLWLLRELDNIDKHRTFVVIQNEVVVTADIESMDGESYSHTFRIATATKPVDADTQLFRVTFDSPRPIATVGVNSQTSRHIFFAEPLVPGCYGIPVFTVVREMISLTNEVIDKFAPFL